MNSFQDRESKELIFNRLHKDLLVGLGRIGRDWEDLGKLEGLEQIVD